MIRCRPTSRALGPEEKNQREHELGSRAVPKRATRVALFALALVAIGVLGLDQLTKYLVVSNFYPGQKVPILGDLLTLQFVTNSGAAFSIGAGYTWIFTVIALAVLVFIVWFARKLRSIAWACLFGLLLGGLLGNLADRLFREPGFGVGHVVDFLKIPILPAIFNIADTAIVASMALFAILTIRGIRMEGAR
jgi:signal peptidase II